MRENVPTAVVKLCISTGRCRRFFWYLQLLGGEERLNLSRRLARQTFLCGVRIGWVDFQRESKVNIARRGFLLVDYYNIQEGSPSQRIFIKWSMLYTLMKMTEILQVASNFLYEVDSVGRIRSY